MSTRWNAARNRLREADSMWERFPTALTDTLSHFSRDNARTAVVDTLADSLHALHRQAELARLRKEIADREAERQAAHLREQVAASLAGAAGSSGRPMQHDSISEEKQRSLKVAQPASLRLIGRRMPDT